MTAVFFLLTAAACAPRRPGARAELPALTPIRKLVVFGFRTVPSQGKQRGAVRDPLSGAFFVGGAPDEEEARFLTENLFRLITERENLVFIPPGQAKGVFSSLVGEDRNLQSSSLELLQAVGRHFAADAVLTGHLFRWEKRVGESYGVDRPASVAFDLHLIRPADGAVVWSGKFDKAQRSLVENLLDLKSFFKSGGRWLSARELALQGLEELVDEIPLGAKKRQDDRS
jgi:hypothetical protein